MALITINGPVWTVRNYFWINLARTPAIALGLTTVAIRAPGFLATLAIGVQLALIVARLFAGRFEPLRPMAGTVFRSRPSVVVRS